jgi:hypothetical protein
LSVSEIDDWTRGVAGCLGEGVRKEERTRGERKVRETHVVWSVRENEHVGTERLSGNHAFEWRTYTCTCRRSGVRSVTYARHDAMQAPLMSTRHDGIVMSGPADGGFQWCQHSKGLLRS